MGCDAVQDNEWTKTPVVISAKSDREVVPDADDAGRLIPRNVDGRQSQRAALARCIRLLLQLPTAQSGARLPHSGRKSDEPMWLNRVLY